MSSMSKEDWERFEQITGSLKIVLESDLEHLRRMDEVKRIGIWNQIEHNQSIFEEEFANRLPRDIMMHSKSEFSFAKLLLAAAAHVNNEKNSITEGFSEKELTLVKNYEKFNVFDILSTDEIVERIHRRGDIYQIVREFYEGQYSDLDRLLDDPEIEKGLRYAFKNYYEKRFDKIRKAVQAYAGKYGPIMVVNQIEQKVWEGIKKSEAERKDIADNLTRRIRDVATKLKSLDKIDTENDTLRDKLRDIEGQILAGKAPSNLAPLESERNRLSQHYLYFEQELADLIDATEKKQRELGTREGELEKAKQEYQKHMQEEKQSIVENELKQIDALKNDLANEARALQEEKGSFQLKRQEIDDRLKQISEALEGKSIRFIAKEDAKLCELNFMGRFNTKMQNFPLKIQSPIEGKAYEIRSWNESSHFKFTEGSASDCPENIRSRYIVAERKYGFFGDRVKKVIIEAVSLNHLKEFGDYGFDTRRANLSELLQLLARFIDSAEVGKYMHVIGVASPTGWDERVMKEIKSTDFAHNYVSRYVSICLIDATTGELVYNPADERITKFVDFFRPQFDRERVERIKNNILRKLSEIDYVVFGEILKETKEERLLVLKAFHDLETDKIYRLRYIKDVGLVLERVRQDS